MITISLLSPSFLVLENNQFSNKSEQAKKWLFSSAMQRLRRAFYWRPKSSISASKWIRSYQIIPLFYFPLQFCIVFVFLTTLQFFQWPQYHFEWGSSTGSIRQALYLLLVLDLKWRKAAFPAVWRSWLPQHVKNSPQTLLDWQLRREESP